MNIDPQHEINLVTGATGLLGSHIAEQLRRRNRPTRALVRPGSDTKFLQSIDVELAPGDITDPKSIEQAMKGVGVVYHSAARVGDWGPWPEFERITVGGTVNMLRGAESAKARRFIHISSISAYGHPDGAGLVLDEKAPLGHGLYRWSYYSRAKVMAEEQVWSAHRDGRVQVTVIRPSWLYGPRDRASLGRLIDNIRRRRAKLIGTGDNRLNVVYAGNVAEAAIAAADREIAIGQAYNCSNDGVLLQRDYFNMIASALGEPPVTRKVPYKVAYNVAFLLECLGHLTNSKRAPFITRYGCWLLGRKCFFETQKARQHLDWKPTVTYETGIPAAVKAYLNNGSQ